MIGCSKWSKACSMFSKPAVAIGTAAAAGASAIGLGMYRRHQHRAILQRAVAYSNKVGFPDPLAPRVPGAHSSYPMG